MLPCDLPDLQSHLQLQCTLQGYWKMDPHATEQGIGGQPEVPLVEEFKDLRRIHGGSFRSFFGIQLTILKLRVSM